MDFVAQTPQFFAEECYAARRLNGFRQQAMIRYGSGNRSADLIWYNSSQSCKNQFLARHYSLLVSLERKEADTYVEHKYSLPWFQSRNKASEEVAANCLGE